MIRNVSLWHPHRRLESVNTQQHLCNNFKPCKIQRSAFLSDRDWRFLKIKNVSGSTLNDVSWDVKTMLQRLCVLIILSPFKIESRWDTVKTIGRLKLGGLKAGKKHRHRSQSSWLNIWVLVSQDSSAWLTWQGKTSLKWTRNSPWTDVRHRELFFARVPVIKRFLSSWPTNWRGKNNKENAKSKQNQK